MDRRPIWALPDRSRAAILAAVPADWTVRFMETPADGSGRRRPARPARAPRSGGRRARLHGLRDPAGGADLGAGVGVGAFGRRRRGDVAGPRNARTGRSLHQLRRHPRRADVGNRPRDDAPFRPRPRCGGEGAAGGAVECAGVLGGGRARHRAGGVDGGDRGIRGDREGGGAQGGRDGGTGGGGAAAGWGGGCDDPAFGRMWQRDRRPSTGSSRRPITSCSPCRRPR